MNNSLENSSNFSSYIKNALRNPVVAGAGVLAISVCIAVCIASYAFYTIKTLDNQLSVTGSAKKSITADRVKWNVSISRPTNASSLPDGYTKIAQDLQIVKAFFLKNGFTENDLEISPVFMDEVYENNQPSPEFKKYTLRQSITITTAEIERVNTLSKNTQEVISKGVLFTVQSPEYSYSNLAELRVTLLAEALKDAEARASSIASVTGNKVGKLKSAASGVVQVLTAGSNDVSDYGTYDTSSIEKDVMVTVRASFNIK